MGVYAHISCSSCQTLVFSKWNMFVRLGIYILLRKTEVDYVDDVLLPIGMPSNEKVLRLHVTIYKTLGMNVFHPSNLDRIKVNQLTNKESVS